MFPRTSGWKFTDLQLLEYQITCSDGSQLAERGSIQLGRIQNLREYVS